MKGVRHGTKANMETVDRVKQKTLQAMSVNQQAYRINKTTE